MQLLELIDRFDSDGVYYRAISDNDEEIKRLAEKAEEKGIVLARRSLDSVANMERFIDQL